MTDLIACVSIGKGTWNEVYSLIDSGEFENIYLVVNSIVRDRFSTNKAVKMIIIDPNSDINLIIDEINSSLQGRINDLEVALNLASGTGKEHMAILSAALKLGIGIRLVSWKNKQLKEL
ncbi:MAG: hypothetical protein ACLFPQ_05820 [Candidatus Woesearchaeota archaeon]